jgi:hypothetical protein
MKRSPSHDQCQENEFLLTTSPVAEAAEQQERYRQADDSAPRRETRQHEK